MLSLVTTLEGDAGNSGDGNVGHGGGALRVHIPEPHRGKPHAHLGVQVHLHAVVEQLVDVHGDLQFELAIREAHVHVQRLAPAVHMHDAGDLHAVLASIALALGDQNGRRGVVDGHGTDHEVGHLCGDAEEHVALLRAGVRAPLLEATLRRDVQPVAEGDVERALRHVVLASPSVAGELEVHVQLNHHQAVEEVDADAALESELVRSRSGLLRVALE
mmetsp:Transcript_30725/g.76426  ORF Transcript_30725/g.76426 Transcript_30725/m.76426 type:complete len:217 (+) Transcript_30725:2031-2681(+)